MTDTPLTPPQLSVLRRLCDAGVLDVDDLHRQDTLSLWALARRGLARTTPTEQWVPTEAGRAWGKKHPTGLLDVTVQCARCGRVLLVAAPGATIQVSCPCTAQPLSRIRSPRTQRPGRVSGQAVAAAAARILEGKMNPQHDLILKFYKAAGAHGITQPELERLPGVDTRAHRTRRGELSEAGYLVDTGQRRRVQHAGPTGRRGALAIVYAITPAALEALGDA